MLCNGSEFEDKNNNPTAAADWSLLGNCVCIVIQVPRASTGLTAAWKENS